MAEIALTNDPEVLGRWVGSERITTEVISALPCQRLADTIDPLSGRDTPRVLRDGMALPPLWHFITHNDSARSDQLGEDGHPVRGGFLPPVALARRMWAGGRIEFFGDLYIGDRVTKRSTVTDVTSKEGRSGPLVFVTVRHELARDEEPVVVEHQDLVYRDAGPRSPSGAGPRSPTEAGSPRVPDAAGHRNLVRTIVPTEVLLFRYSALTFNGHRIHYDRSYAQSVEGYPDLVVHGPLLATQLADLAVVESATSLREFTFRAHAPLFCGTPFTISATPTGSGFDLSATSSDGILAMTASTKQS